MSNLNVALHYLERGLSIFPVCTPIDGKPDYCHQHGHHKKDGMARPGKMPLVKWAEFQQRQPTEDEVRAWWKRWPNANIGVCTGELSGVVVLDIDGMDAFTAVLSNGGVEQSPTVATGKANGFHHYLQHPGRRVRNFASPTGHHGLDFRGDGGYAVLPPSVHESGRVYSWHNDTEELDPPTIPDWLMVLLDGSPGAAGATERPALDIERILDGLPHGERDDTLWRFASKMRGDGVPQYAAEATIREVAQNCDPPFDVDTAIEKVRRAYAEFPVNQKLSATQKKAKANAGGRTLDLVTFDSIEPEKIDWLWRWRLPRGKLTLLMGDPGLGKSLITHWLAATISTGGEWPDGGQSPAGDVILFTVEDGLADTVTPRLMAAGANLSRVHAVRGVRDGNSSPDKDLPDLWDVTQDLSLIEAAIVEHGAVCVIYDPIVAYMGGDVNTNSDKEVRQALSPLAMLAERLHIVVVMVCHLNKGTGIKALYRAGGSIAFGAICRVVLGVAPDSNDEDGKRRVLLPVKGNLSPDPEGIGYRIETAQRPSTGGLRNITEEDQPPMLIWDKEPVLIDATSAMDRNGSVQELGSISEVKSALLEILKDGRVLASTGKREIKDATGATSEAVISRARKELGVKVKKEGFNNGSVWWWYPPGTTTQDARRIIEESRRNSLSHLGNIDSLRDSSPTDDGSSRKTIEDSEDYRRFHPSLAREADERTVQQQLADLSVPLGEIPRGVTASGAPLCETCRVEGRMNGVLPGTALCAACHEKQAWIARQIEEEAESDADS